MDPGDLSALIVSGCIILLIAVLALVLLSGRGAMLIAGYNTMPRREREKINAPVLCRFVGKLLLIVCVILCAAIYGGYAGIDWLAILCTVLIFAVVIGAIIYLNIKKPYLK